MLNKTIKSSIQAIEDIKAILIQSRIYSALTGSIYIVSRPLGSGQEDIVINTVYFDADQVQIGVLNINIYVPNLKRQLSDNPIATDSTQPNEARIREIGALVVSALDGYIGSDFSLTMRDSGSLEGYNNDWYLNIEVTYEHLRTDLI